MDSTREPWWFYLWVIWGVVLAFAVGWIDHSFVEGLLCVGVGILLGRYGMSLWQRLVMMLFRPGHPDSLGRFDDTDPNHLHWMVENSLTLLNPQRKPWETYLGNVVGVGVFHGLLIGPIMGAIYSLYEEFELTAWQGALLGCVGGPLFICCVYALATPIIFAQMCRWPSIERIRMVVRAAADEANRLGHNTIRHEHLLIAMLRHPAGAVAILLEDSEADLASLGDSIVSQTPTDEGDQVYEGSWSWILHDAIQRAKKLRHKEVDPGHLLLAFLDAWPTLTNEVLAKAGLEEVDVSKRLVEFLNRS